MKMIISAGGTGGHIYPALAIVEKFKKCEKDFEVLYIGTHNRMEKDIVPNHNIQYVGLTIYGFSKKDIIRDIKNCKYIYNSFNKCIEIMKDFKPDVVIGVGGYVTLPVIMAARQLKIKTVLHEQNSIPGKTNKFLSRGVDLVCTSFENSAKYFNKDVNISFTGNPCADNIKKMDKTELGLSKDKKLLIVTSGSLGSSTVNEKIIEFLKLMHNENFEVLFVTGKSNYEEVIKNKFSKSVKVVPYLDNLSSVLKSADLMISRAGASTIAEIKMAKIPTILVPSPNVANNHQFYNALSLTDKNEALMIEEKNLKASDLYNLVKGLLQDNNKIYDTIKDNLCKEKKINSSDKIYKEIKKLITKI